MNCKKKKKMWRAEMFGNTNCNFIFMMQFNFGLAEVKTKFPILLIQIRRIPFLWLWSREIIVERCINGNVRFFFLSTNTRFFLSLPYDEHSILVCCQMNNINFLLRLLQVRTNYNNQKINIVQTLHTRINIYILVREKKKLDAR